MRPALAVFSAGKRLFDRGLKLRNPERLLEELETALEGGSHPQRMAGDRNDPDPQRTEMSGQRRARLAGHQGIEHHEIDPILPRHDLAQRFAIADDRGPMTGFSQDLHEDHPHAFVVIGYDDVFGGGHEISSSNWPEQSDLAISTVDWKLWRFCLATGREKYDRLRRFSWNQI
jgi:hypothetical protein